MEVSNVSQTLTAGSPTDEEPPPSKSTTVVKPSGDDHTHTVIFLHGREDFGTYMAEILDDKSSDGRTLPERFPSTRWVFPTAQIRFSARRKQELCISSFPSLEGEEFISQWFDVWDVKNPEERAKLAIPGLQESIKQIVDIIQEEARIVPVERIILGGISQGCATAILTLLSSGLSLGGFIGWCGWLPFQSSIEELDHDCIGDKHEISRQFQANLQLRSGESRRIHKMLQKVIPASNEITSLNEAEIVRPSKDVEFSDLARLLTSLSESTTPAIKTPIFLAHSKDDEIVPFKLGNELRQIMKRLGFDVTWKQYEDGGHWIHPEHGLDDMLAFLERVMKN
ncbi:alpha/beta-hydrolase [Stipitochalara longipes BDJ]|nr:alpha/beta-hydrolase [Stipitochalara longipes BDJ]